jgi:large subunit ribosomal protein L1
MTTHHGRRHKESVGKVDRERQYAPAEAISLLKELAGAKFDESVEVHIRTGLNVRHADEQLRGTIALPHGLGKEVKVAVFAQGGKATEAQEAGADVVGGEDLAKKIEEGFDDFDVTIATPDMMAIVGRLGRILGPSGKMPNPKVGTVTMDVKTAVEASKSGKVEYRTDRNAIVHLVIGKRSFEQKMLLENYAAVIEELVRAKPSAAKGRYLRTITLASTMGPGVKVDPSRTRDIAEEAPGKRSRLEVAGGASLQLSCADKLYKRQHGTRDLRPLRVRPGQEPDEPRAEERGDRGDRRRDTGRGGDLRR